MKSHDALRSPDVSSRSPHGERGLKYRSEGQGAGIGGRSPHGERGLKYIGQLYGLLIAVSLSSWRAWIEIDFDFTDSGMGQVALLMESVD